MLYIYGLFNILKLMILFFQVDSDLVFDIEDPVVRELELKKLHKNPRKYDKRQTKALLEKELISSAESHEKHEEEPQHWFTRTVHRIKRDLWDDWFSSKSEKEKEIEKQDSREKRSSKEEDQHEVTEDDVSLLFYILINIYISSFRISDGVIFCFYSQLYNILKAINNSKHTLIFYKL